MHEPFGTLISPRKTDACFQAAWQYPTPQQVLKAWAAGQDFRAHEALCAKKHVSFRLLDTCTHAHICMYVHVHIFALQVYLRFCAYTVYTLSVYTHMYTDRCVYIYNYTCCSAYEFGVLALQAWRPSGFTAQNPGMK